MNELGLREGGDDFRSRLVSDLRRLGLTTGDCVLVRAATRQWEQQGVGLPARDILRDACLEVVGPGGTLVGLTFTRQVPIWRRKNAAPFDENSSTNAGGFARSMLDHPHRQRSRHPTNSFCAIGAQADTIVLDHGPDTTGFAPIGKLVALDGKMLVVGCIESSPGFSTVHFAQETLGLAFRTPLSSLTGAWYIDTGGRRRWCSRRELPGCSMGFGKLYGDYVKAGIITVGRLAGANAILAACRDALQVETAVLRRNPRAALCDNPGCASCATWYYNKRAWLRFIVHALGGRISI
jgi:aminoglycoside 3-N-acetyltransferase